MEEAVNSELRLRLPFLNQAVSRIGFGCCPMGQHGWGRVEERDLIEAVHVALDLGINFFDTADIYGLGVSEATLGKALPGRRNEAVIATKFGARRCGAETFYDNSAGWITQAVEESLGRLRTDYIDLYQVHRWDGKTPIAEVLGTLSSLRQAGKIRTFGVTNVDLLALRLQRSVEGLISFSFEYSLARRDHEAMILRHAKELNLIFFSWGSLGQGVLSGKYSLRTQFNSNDRRSREAYMNFYGERFQRNLRIVDYMRSLLPFYSGKTVSQIALRWVLDKIPQSVALVGIKQKEQIRSNSGALGWTLEPEHLRQLDEVSSIEVGEL